MKWRLMVWHVWAKVCMSRMEGLWKMLASQLVPSPMKLASSSSSSSFVWPTWLWCFLTFSGLVSQGHLSGTRMILKQRLAGICRWAVFIFTHIRGKILSFCLRNHSLFTSQLVIFIVHIYVVWYFLALIYSHTFVFVVNCFYLSYTNQKSIIFYMEVTNISRLTCSCLCKKNKNWSW